MKINYKKLYKDEFDFALNYLRKNKDDQAMMKLLAKNYFGMEQVTRNATGNLFELRVASSAQLNALKHFKKEQHKKGLTIYGKKIRK